MSKKVLITGAGSGLGKGTAIGLARAGHDVIAGVEIWPQATALRKEVDDLGLGDRLRVEKLDIREQTDIDTALALDFDTFVANAAIGESGPIAEIPMELVRKTFETNVFANLDLVQQVVRKFVDGSVSGSVIFTSSMGGLISPPGYGAYCATKHAIEAIAETMRQELEPFGIRVQTINPGAYETGYNDAMAETTYHWQDDSVNFTKEADIRESFDELLADQFDPQDMIDKMVEVIGAEGGRFRNVWPPEVEEMVKEEQAKAWTLEV